MSVDVTLCLANGFSRVWQKILFWWERDEKLGKAFHYFMTVTVPGGPSEESVRQKIYC